jgi:hypothetical protein
MNRRRFVVTSTLSMLAITVAVAGLAFYSNFAAKAFHSSLPTAISYLPADTQAVFGMNVHKFLISPAYAQLMAKSGPEIGAKLAEFTAMTGVDPSSDLTYIIAAARARQQKDSGVVIASGNFNQAKITAFINSHETPIPVSYSGVTVLMRPETSASGARLEKGVAFLDQYNIALGDLDSLKAVIDAKQAPGISNNTTLPAMVANLDPAEMFWFAGDASVLSKVPQNTPMLPSLSAIQSVFGTLDFSTPDAGVTITLSGHVTVTAKDPKAASQLGDFARGLVALGSLAGGQNPDLAALIAGVTITPKDNQLDITLSIPFNLLQKLEGAKGKFGVDAPLPIK